MKKAILPVIITSLLVFVKPSQYNQPRELHPVNYFCPGDTLFPDYVCPDTLVVVDAAGLNYGLGLIEQGIVDGTDGDIDSIIHANCREISGQQVK